VSHQTTINLIGGLLWMFIGAAVLSATHRGLLDVMESLSKDESAKNVMLPMLGVPGIAAIMIFFWLISCLLWPLVLIRFFQRRGLINGHIARECPHRILTKEREDKTRNSYKHGDCTRR
jgi:hypothetical protein